MSDKKREISRRNLLKLGAVAGAGAVSLGAVTRSRAEDAPAENKAAPGATDEVLPQVPRRILGKTGQSIPILLMGGAMPLDRRFDPKLAECLRFGVNYIDAADCYTGGSCEVAVGNFITRAEVRDEVWITSKSDAHDPEGLEATLIAGLEKMKTDYVNMYYLHALKSLEPFTPELEATVARLKKEGKIRYFGFSCHDGNVAELLHKAAETPWIDSVMFRYNFRQYGDKTLNDAMDACVKANVGLIAMKTQGSAESFEAEWQKFEGTGKWTKHQAVLKAVWADERITAAVSHMDTFEKLKQNIAAACDKTELGVVDRHAIEKYAAATHGEACHGCDQFCGAAVSAPVEIGTTMRYLMYHDVYGEKAKAKELFGKLPAGARNLADVDFRPANAACPHGVDVARHMERARKVFHA